MRGEIVYEGCLWRISAVLDDMWGRMISEMAQREKVISHDTAVFDSNDLESILLELYLL